MLNFILAMAIALTIGDKYMPYTTETKLSEDLATNGALVHIDMDGNFTSITPEEINLLNRVVMSEAGSQSIETQEAVATVILNRWLHPDKFPDTITGVITAEGQFSTADNGKPTVSVRTAVYNAIFYYNTEDQIIPSQVYYFRDSKYHTFGIPYCSMDNLYFSLDEGACID